GWARSYTTISRIKEPPGRSTPRQATGLPQRGLELHPKSSENVAMGPKRINLALQGGGAHGAFTWGVLDRLLEDERLGIEGISGTSAGGMNAGALLQGYLRGGRSGAREALDRFWHHTSELAAYNPIRATIVDHLIGNWNLDREPVYVWADSLARL